MTSHPTASVLPQPNSGTSRIMPLSQRRVPSFKLQDGGCPSPNKKMKRRIPSFRGTSVFGSIDDIDVQGGLQGRKASFSLDNLEMPDPLSMTATEPWGGSHANLSGTTPRAFAIDDTYLLGDGHKVAMDSRIPSFRTALELSDIDLMGDVAAGAAADVTAKRCGGGRSSDSQPVSLVDLDALADKRVADSDATSAVPTIEGFGDARRIPSFSFLDDMLPGDIPEGGLNKAAASGGGGMVGAGQRSPSSHFMSKKMSFGGPFDSGMLDLVSPRKFGSGKDHIDLDQLLVSLHEVPSGLDHSSAHGMLDSAVNGSATAAAVVAAAHAFHYQQHAHSAGGMVRPGSEVAAAHHAGNFMHQYPAGAGHVRSLSGCSSEGVCKRQTSEEVAKRLPVSVLENFYHVPLNIAAKELNVSLTMLKKLCRQDGIKRWPHRQVSSLNKSIEKLEQKLMTCKEEKAVKAILAKMAPLQNKRMLIIKTASAGLEPDVLNAIFAARPGELNEEEILRSGDYSKLTELLAAMAKEKRESLVIMKDPMCLDGASRDSIGSSLTLLPLELSDTESKASAKEEAESSRSVFGSLQSGNFMLDPPQSAPGNMESYSQGFSPPTSSKKGGAEIGAAPEISNSSCMEEDSQSSSSEQKVKSTSVDSPGQQQQQSDNLSPSIQSTSTFFRNKLVLGGQAPASSAELETKHEVVGGNAAGCEGEH